MANEDFRAETPGEKALLAGLSSGEVVAIGGTERPSADAGPDRQIRADFLRAVLLEKLDDAPLPEKGVRIAGARITGVLDLEGCTLGHDFSAFDCHFDATPMLRSARVQNQFLNDSFLPGMRADRFDATGGVYLRGVVAKGEVRLLGASVGGDLTCAGARFTAGKGGKALSADRLDAKGSVFFRDVVADGEVRLLGATLGSNLDCDGARFKAGKGGMALSADRLDAKGSVFLRKVVAEGEVRIVGATVGGNLGCDGARVTAKPGGGALNLQGIRVAGAFFLREASKIAGPLDLTGAEIGHICDEEASWPEPGDLFLNRCRYGPFVGKNIDANSRIRWLRLQEPERWGDDFRPQPWEQCAQVLRAMGHRDDAREVLIDKERRQRAAARKRMVLPAALPSMGLAAIFGGVVWGLSTFAFGLFSFIAASLFIGLNWWRWTLDQGLRWVVAYGHRPFRAAIPLGLLLLVGWGIFARADAIGAIKPNQPVVLRGDEWVGCRPGHVPTDGVPALNNGRETQLRCFLNQPQAKSYPRFQPFVYAADTLLPIVDLEMQGYWIPDDTAGRFGAFARFFLWTEIALGWALSLLAVAGFSGLIRTDGK